jgi:endonuclease/exonuclease/phosphatase family metal-dependent hydrolase
VEEFLVRGFVDAHAGLPAEIRGTRGILVIDLLFGSGSFFRDPGVCERERCPLSDHQPVWATVVLDDEQR